MNNNCWLFRRGLDGAPDEFIVPDPAQEWMKWGSDEEEANGLKRESDNNNVVVMADEKKAAWHFTFGTSECFTVRCEGFLDQLIFRTKYYAPYAAVDGEELAFHFRELEKVIERSLK